MSTTAHASGRDTGQEGFTLVELVISLGILSLGILCLMNMSINLTRQVNAVQADSPVSAHKDINSYGQTKALYLFPATSSWARVLGAAATISTNPVAPALAPAADSNRPMQVLGMNVVTEYETSYLVIRVQEGTNSP